MHHGTNALQRQARLLSQRQRRCRAQMKAPRAECSLPALPTTRMTDLRNRVSAAGRGAERGQFGVRCVAVVAVRHQREDGHR